MRKVGWGTIYYNGDGITKDYAKARSGIGKRLIKVICTGSLTLACCMNSVTG